MSALPIDQYSVARLRLYVYYPTPEAYRKATGQEPPPFNPNRPPKRWADLEAAKSQRRTITYDRALVLTDAGVPLVGPEGIPLLEPLVLSRAEAATVNIPTVEQINELAEAQIAEVPVPLRALDSEEELFFGFGGEVLVRNKKIWASQIERFTAEDRAVLQAIARKLNVPLAE